MKNYTVTKVGKALLILALVVYLPLNAAAWGMLGHRIVGQIAEGYLSNKAKKGIKDVLGNESLAMASNWGDFIKSDPAYDYLYNWHFVNLPAGLDKQGVFDQLDKETSPNVYNKIPEMAAVLKNRQSTAEEKRLAMRLLIHLVGDLNQPMHTARKEDLGGNKVFVTWFGEKSNLHRVWDEGLIEYQQLSYTEYANAINYPSNDQLNSWRNNSLKDFVYGSYQACNRIYADIKPEERLSYKYNFEFVGLLNEQLLKGGICLANMLNDIYK
ncbi:S1/P1 nuclease [Pedobacter heparinus]|uniref:S1/P1 nuclease n=1 Tax=Pedobacter heparinus (strain ATCC 13125 / DSM 2366 / CIP 104194 / JCM 7457 / NBRC 12017 / NCIMB 9290 / NRRL B-14731 / HIM 762-3) TaxID=485917 RepID=C6XYC1_PEDHD|nr:S1/P1 nuclease [Pedobacter heparinus]ACU02388.1 S1/P1 nuclease [Pedobacter heparinus DSM 2366]